MPSHDLLPGDRSPAVQGIAVVKSWGPPVETIIVAAKGNGIVFIDNAAATGMETPTWELVEVTKNSVRLRCPCHKPGCTREAVYRRVIKGQHPQSR